MSLRKPRSLQGVRGPRRLPVEALFWSKVSRSISSECWIWLGCLDRYGYGVFSYWLPNGRCRTRRAWIWAMELTYGEIDPRAYRPCVNTACANPAHIKARRLPKISQVPIGNLR